MRLLPREEKFFEYFQKQTDLIASAAHILKEALVTGDLEAKSAQLDQMETEGDHLLRDLSKALQASFVTPLDAEDIHRLAVAFDGILDSIENSAYMFNLYGVTYRPREMAEVADEIILCAKELQKAQLALSKSEPTDSFFSVIADSETKADKLCAKMLTDLFDKEDDFKRLIKAKEVIQMLEETTDKFLIAADIIENVYIKNS
jgi:uncharacterized protein